MTGTQAEVSVSIPGTPEGTPAPLFPSRRVDSQSYDRSSMPRCQCLPDGSLGFGPGPVQACLSEFKVPDVTLTRKVNASVILGAQFQLHHALFYFIFFYFSLLI